MANLSARFFNEDTRLTHNVAGRGKPALDPAVISYIRTLSFKYYPCNVGEKYQSGWAECIKAIDECSRHLKKSAEKELCLTGKFYYF